MLLEIHFFLFVLVIIIHTLECRVHGNDKKPNKASEASLSFKTGIIPQLRKVKIHEIPTDVKFCSTDLLQDFCLQSVQLPLEGEINHKTLPNLSLCKIGGGVVLRFLQSRPGVCPSRPLS